MWCSSTLADRHSFPLWRTGGVYSVEITEDTIQAVDQALEGEDYSQGALFFMARQSSDSSSVEWFDSELKPLILLRRS